LTCDYFSTGWVFDTSPLDLTVCEPWCFDTVSSPREFGGLPAERAGSKANINDYIRYLRIIEWYYLAGSPLVFADCIDSFYAVEVTTPAQIRAARALIAWTQADLAKASGVSQITIKKIERGIADPRVSTLAAIARAFDGAGIIFLDADDCRPGGPGVRLKKAGSGKPPN
jgi:DNA-binding XRE family transcriptional regulator